MSGQTISPFLIESLASLLLKDVEVSAKLRASRHLIDWMGCAFAGRVELAGEVIRSVDFPGASGMAFRWGALGNILEMDDVDKRAILHPGPSIIPAALALCSDRPDLLPRLLESIVVGYEATIRLGRATGAAHYSKWHTSGTCGAIGAAAACARLLELDAAQTAHALALAMSQAAGLWQTRHEPQSMGKQLHTSHAARAGLDAARLAAAGFKGPLSILEGEQGFFAACAPDGNPSAILYPYGDDWLIHQVSFKPWPACRHAHAAIDAALDINECGVDPKQFQTIKVTTYPDAIKFCDKPNPASTIEAKFSLQHSVGVVLFKGRPELADFDPAALSNQDFVNIRRKVTVEVGEPFASAYPAQYGARVEVFGRDGMIAVADVPDALGDPENPLMPERIDAKASVLMGHAGIAGEDASRFLLLAAKPTRELITRLLELL
jgi:2-methylcitrate dehydratase PrpD